MSIFKSRKLARIVSEYASDDVRYTPDITQIKVSTISRIVSEYNSSYSSNAFDTPDTPLATPLDISDTPLDISDTPLDISDTPSVFKLPRIINTIIAYTSCDVICDKILRMKWDKSVLGRAEVSYLSYIVNKYHRVLLYDDLNKNPMVTDDLTPKLKYMRSFSCNPHNRKPLDVGIRDIPSSQLRQYMLWENPNFPYQRVIDQGKHEIKWHWLSFNPNITSEFLYKYRNKFGYYTLSINPKAGKLLLGLAEEYDEMVLKNPSLPFGQVKIWNLMLSTPDKVSCLLQNPNLPIDFIVKYGCDKGKLNLLVYECNNNIRQILEMFPGDSQDVDYQKKIKEALLKNLAYYVYCVEEAVKKCLGSI